MYGFIIKYEHGIKLIYTYGLGVLHLFKVFTKTSEFYGVLKTNNSRNNYKSNIKSFKIRFIKYLYPLIYV